MDQLSIEPGKGSIQGVKEFEFNVTLAAKKMMLMSSTG